MDCKPPRQKIDRLSDSAPSPPHCIAHARDKRLTRTCRKITVLGSAPFHLVSATAWTPSRRLLRPCPCRLLCACQRTSMSQRSRATTPSPRPIGQSLRVPSDRSSIKKSRRRLRLRSSSSWYLTFMHLSLAQLASNTTWSVDLVVSTHQLLVQLSLHRVLTSYS